MNKINYSSIVIITTVIISILSGCNVQKKENPPISSQTVNPKQTNTLNKAANYQDKTIEPSKDANMKKEYKKNLSTEDEDLLFSFKIADSPKILSVCLSKKQSDYIVYRFGTKDKIELEFPENKSDSWNKFTYSYYLRGGGKENEGMELNYLSFENGGNEYQIYHEYTAEDGSTIVGIKITEKATNKVTDIKGLSNSIEGSLINLRDNNKINTEIL
ncbi:MAG: hypothetical protein WA118_05100 [Carboxydocellales bacterium]